MGKLPLSKGVFETMLVVEGRPVELDAHMARLGASLEALYGAAAPVGVRDDLLAKTGGVSLGRVRLTVAPADGGLAYAIAVADVDRAAIFPGWDRGVALRGVAAPDWAGGHKWADRSGLERLEASLGEAVPLLLGEGGVPLETSRANVFAVRGGTLTTPPLDGRVLPGIARARAIEIAGALSRGTRAGNDARRPPRRRRGLPHRLRARHRAGPLPRRRRARAPRRRNRAPRRPAAPTLAWLRSVLSGQRVVRAAPQGGSLQLA